MKQADENRKCIGLEFWDKLAKQLIGGYVGRADVRRRESQKRALTVDISPENATNHFISKIVGRKRECVHQEDTKRTRKGDIMQVRTMWYCALQRPMFSFVSFGLKIIQIM